MCCITWPCFLTELWKNMSSNKDSAQRLNLPLINAYMDTGGGCHRHSPAWHPSHVNKEFMLMTCRFCGPRWPYPSFLPNIKLPVEQETEAEGFALLKTDQLLACQRDVWLAHGSIGQLCCEMWADNQNLCISVSHMEKATPKRLWLHPSFALSVSHIMKQIYMNTTHNWCWYNLHGNNCRCHH